MMTKIRSVQDSWAAKSILILTALSFMSLFGVSGYLSSAGKNRPIIKVDDIIVYQDEIRNQYNQELQAAKNLFGDNIDVNDNMKNAILKYRPERPGQRHFAKNLRRPERQHQQRSGKENHLFPS